MGTNKPDVMDEGVMTIPEVAEFAKVTRMTIYKWLNEMGLPSIKVGRTRRIPRRALLDFLREHLG